MSPLPDGDPVASRRARARRVLRGRPRRPYLLRTGGNSDSFWAVWDDMTQVLRLLKLPVPDKSRKK